ncbi:MAG TPA: hypothetical protein VMT91_08130 [Anaerolineales bacterium]|nr:hypothetical protein [Anaerolineales bacterium]
MKTNLRLFLAAVVLAGVAALAFRPPVWAAPSARGMESGCPGSASTKIIRGYMQTCSSRVYVFWLPLFGSVNDSEIDLSPYGLVPGSKNYGPGVNISFYDMNKEQVDFGWFQVCFPDPGGVGTIYRWWSSYEWSRYFQSNESGHWFASPTYHNPQTGYSCSTFWSTGVFTIVH